MNFSNTVNLRNDLMAPEVINDSHNYYRVLDRMLEFN